jgi:predicted ester cyclase
MSTEANKVLVRRYREAHNTNNLALLDEIVAADIKSHSGMPGLSSGLDGGKMVHRGFLAAFSDGHVTTEDLIAEGDQVVERFSFRSTNTGSLMHASATGKKGAFSGVSVFCIANCS